MSYCVYNVAIVCFSDVEKMQPGTHKMTAKIQDAVENAGWQ